MSKKAWRQNQAEEDNREFLAILDEAHDQDDEEWNPTLDEIFAEEQEIEEEAALKAAGR